MFETRQKRCMLHSAFDLGGLQSLRVWTLHCSDNFLCIRMFRPFAFPRLYGIACFNPTWPRPPPAYQHPNSAAPGTLVSNFSEPDSIYERWTRVKLTHGRPPHASRLPHLRPLPCNMTRTFVKLRTMLHMFEMLVVSEHVLIHHAV